MMKNKTIKEAIVDILKLENVPLSSSEIYKKIVDKKLYEFKAKNPIAIVNSELRKNCYGVNLKKSNSDKIFERIENGKFMLRAQ